MLDEIEFSKVDDFLNTEKHILEDNIIWQRDQNKNSQSAVIQLLCLNDNILDLMIDFKFSAKVNYYTSLNETDTGTIIILYKGIIITRMHINPGNPHTNKYINDGSLECKNISFKTLNKGITRFYPWKYRKIELKNRIIESYTAVPIENIKTFKECFDFFKKECNIIGEIPLPALSNTLL